MPLFQRRLRSHSSTYNLPDSKQNAKQWHRGFALWRWQHDRQQQHDDQCHTLPMLEERDRIYLQEWAYLQRVDFRKFQRGEKSFLYQRGFALLTRLGFQWDDTHDAGETEIRHENIHTRRAVVVSTEDEGKRKTATETLHCPFKKPWKGPTLHVAQTRSPLSKLATRDQNCREATRSHCASVTASKDNADKYDLQGDRLLPLTTTGALARGARDISEQQSFDVRSEAPCARHFEFSTVDKTRLSWDCWFERLVWFKAEHGHVRVPASHQPANQKRLYDWLRSQRKRRVQKPNQNSGLTIEQYEKLLDIGVSFTAS